MVKLFEYGKNNKKYWDSPKLYKQVVTRALSIAEVLYLEYLFLFLFDNTISHSFYIDNALYTIGINKKSGKKYIWLNNE